MNCTPYEIILFHFIWFSYDILLCVGIVFLNLLEKNTIDIFVLCIFLVHIFMDDVWNSAKICVLEYIKLCILRPHILFFHYFLSSFTKIEIITMFSLNFLVQISKFKSQQIYKKLKGLKSLLE